MQAFSKAKDFAGSITMTIDCFEFAAHRGQFWFDISDGCNRLKDVLQSRDNRISVCERSGLLYAITKARMEVYGQTGFDPAAPDGRCIIFGFDALACLAIYLAEDMFLRSCRPRELLAALKAHARILQNVAHNRTLEEELRGSFSGEGVFRDHLRLDLM